MSKEKSVKIMAMSIVVCFILLSQCHAEMYKWTDENGVIHFQDYPPSAIKPSTTVEKFTKEQLKFNNYIEGAKKSEDKSSYTSGNDDVRKSKSDKGANVGNKKQYAENQSVELYVTSWCVYCKKARAFLNSRGIDFVVYDIEKDRAAAERHKRLNKRGGVPVALINGKKILGFSEASYERALKKR